MSPAPSTATTASAAAPSIALEMTFPRIVSGVRLASAIAQRLDYLEPPYLLAVQKSHLALELVGDYARCGQASRGSARRPKCSAPCRALDLDDDRHRAVVDDLDGHARTEDAGLNRDAKIA